MVAATASGVFLSYSPADAQAVAAMRACQAAGQPGQPLLEKELARSGAVAVFLGQRIGSWQHREVQLAI